MANSLIVKRNELVEAKYNLSLVELKLIAKLTSTIQMDDIEFKSCVFTIKELMEDLELSDNYKNLKNTIRKLLTEVVEIKTENSTLTTTFLSSAEYYKNGTIELCFDTKLQVYLLQLKDNFTKYQLENVSCLKSIYAIRIYELCKQYEKLKERKINVEALKEILNITSKSYSVYNNFKRKVLETAIKEINKKTDIIIKMSEIKTSKKITDILFQITKKFSKEPLATSEFTEPVIIESIDKNIKDNNITVFSNEVETLYNKIKLFERIPTLKDYLENILKTTDYRVVESNIIYANKNAVHNYPAFLKRAIAEDFASDNRIKAKSIKAIKNIIPTNLSENNNVSNDGLSEEEIFERLKKVPTAEYIKLKKEYDNNKFIKKDIVSLERYVVINAIEN